MPQSITLFIASAFARLYVIFTVLFSRGNWISAGFFSRMCPVFGQKT